MNYKPEDDNSSSNSAETDDGDEPFERPDWDDETYAHTTDNDEDFDRPDWDDETWFKRFKKPLGGLVTVLAAIAIVFFAVPGAGSQVLTVAGARGQVSFSVLDEKTNKPLVGVAVTIDGVTEQTNRLGSVVFSDIKLGKKEVLVQTSAYETRSLTYHIGWGNNDQQSIAIKPVGTEFNFEVVDWLSKQALSGVLVEGVERKAYTEDDGQTLITVIADDSGVTQFSFSLDGYQTKLVDVSNSSELNTVELVIAQKHHFIDREDERQSVYSVEADGSGRQLVLAGTSDITDDMLFTVADDNQTAALVARSVGSDLISLFVVDLFNGLSNEIDSSTAIDLVGWVDGSIVYVKIAEDAGAKDPLRHRLIAHDTATNTSRELAASNFFNDIITTEKYVFYAPSELYKEDAEPKLYRSRVDGSSQLTVIDEETWAIVRSGYDLMSYNSQQAWYQGGIEDLNPASSQAPDTELSRLYQVNPWNKELAAWAEINGQTGKLHIENTVTGEDSIVYEMPGLRDPLRWLDEGNLVFRVNKDGEVADYIYSLAGELAVKLVTVSDVRGVENWYYYYD